MKLSGHSAGSVEIPKEVMLHNGDGYSQRGRSILQARKIVTTESGQRNTTNRSSTMHRLHTKDLIRITCRYFGL